MKINEVFSYELLTIISLCILYISYLFDIFVGGSERFLLVSLDTVFNLLSAVTQAKLIDTVVLHLKPVHASKKVSDGKHAN